jgi:hypothetical protein
MMLQMAPTSARLCPVPGILGSSFAARHGSSSHFALLPRRGLSYGMWPSPAFNTDPRRRGSTFFACGRGGFGPVNWIR